jgi:hypothetical protein
LKVSHNRAEKKIFSRRLIPLTEAAGARKVRRIFFEDEVVRPRPHKRRTEMASEVGATTNQPGEQNNKPLQER